LLARQRELLDRHTGIMSPNSSEDHYDITPPRRPLYDSAAGTEVASSSPAGADADEEQGRYRRILMMRQRLSSGGTIMPSDSPALNLPASSGRYQSVIADRIQRLQVPHNS
jgi:hypothetical protein